MLNSQTCFCMYLVFFTSLLVACSSDNENIVATTEQEQTVEKIVEEITADDEGTVVMEALENESKEVIDEEISLEGKVFIEEDRIRVQGTTNLKKEPF
ncbi:hypothetical protein [Alkalihalobacterium bogoriense]|uniref:hypothetical protein n=1 Tax=Alkalihalobacterium bogoriense TaxID=246272 RepID=UPI00047C9CE3|nr:hypothetical protein [Alkalihalobacterium bogoriense]